MKTTPFPAFPAPPYSLHDCSVTGYDYAAEGGLLTLRFAAGFVEIGSPCARVAGELLFTGLDPDFCFAYTLAGCGNEGSFTGRKQPLLSFLAGLGGARFEVCDETYGYRSARYDGYLFRGEAMDECFLSLYYAGGLRYRTGASQA